MITDTPDAYSFIVTALHICRKREVRQENQEKEREAGERKKDRKKEKRKKKMKKKKKVTRHCIKCAKDGLFMQTLLVKLYSNLSKLGIQSAINRFALNRLRKSV